MVYAAAFIPPAFALIILGVGGLVAMPVWVALLGPIAGVLGSLGMAVASALAIFRYRLWDIDIIIRHTLQYGLLSASLALVYFSSIVLLQRLLERTTRQGLTLAIVGSTLMIAALFSPFRKRIQGFIDRRFYRRQYDIEQIMASFSAGLREDVNLEQMSRRLKAIVKETLQPESLSLWLMEPGGSQPGPAVEASGTAIRPWRFRPKRVRTTSGVSRDYPPTAA